MVVVLPAPLGPTRATSCPALAAKLTPSRALPLSVPGLISAGIFAFTLAQNEFLYALIFLTKTEVRTVPVGAIAELVRGDVFYWGQLMAAALLGSIPVAIIYSFFVEHYVAGLTTGAVKG